MKEGRLKWRLVYSLALLVQVTYSNFISPQCPNKSVSCHCLGEKHVKTKVSQCQFGTAGCKPCERRVDLCLKVCAKSRQNRNINGKGSILLAIVLSKQKNDA
mgnify:FL=1